MRYEPFDWYETPLLYDIVHGQGSDDDAAFVDAAHTLYGGRSRTKRALEPACGSGRVMLGLHDRGWNVVGFDTSEGMLALAAKRCPRSALSRQSMVDFRLRGRFDLAYNLASTFKHLESERDARRHLVRVADVVRSGGLYLLGLHASNYDDSRRKRERWTGRRDGTHVVCNMQRWPADARRRRERARARLIVERNGRTRRYETCWNFRSYDATELRGLIAQEPRFQHLATYGFDHDLRRPHALGDGQLDHVLVLRRR